MIIMSARFWKALAAGQQPENDCSPWTRSGQCIRLHSLTGQPVTLAPDHDERRVDCQSCTSSCSCPVRRCLLPSKYPCLIRADWSGLMVSSTLFMSYWWQQRVWSKNSWDGQSQCLVYSRFCLSFTRGVTDVFICKWWGLRSFPFTTRLLRRGFKDKSRFCLEKVNL